MADQAKKDITPQLVIVRHRSGSKANQVEQFPLDQYKEITFGRTATSSVKYDPDHDDLVSREHAKIEQDSNNPNQFTITDLNSRNGTFVNKQRIIGLAHIKPGDEIQFGPGGPGFEFDLDPRPDSLMKSTRIAEGPAALAATPQPTREHAVSATSTNAPDRTPAEPAKPAVGKATVERMVAQSQGKSNRTMMMGAFGLLALVILVGGFLYYQNQQTKADVDAGLSSASADLAGVSSRVDFMTPAEIAAANEEKVVLIEVAWKLVHTGTGGQLYHEYVFLTDDNGQQVAMPSYIQMADGAIEPVLTLDNGGGLNKPIGATGGGGSGFIVGAEGFILTNRHVAAAWNSPYQFPADAVPGAIVELNADGDLMVAAMLEQPVHDWIPTAARQLGGKPVSGKFAEGRNDYLDVTFPNTERRIPARLVAPSNRHDVAMIKVDIPEALPKVEIPSASSIDPETLKGASVTVMGYPGIAPQPIVGEVAQDLGTRFSSGGAVDAKVVPDPTVTPGNIGRISKGQQAPAGRSDDLYLSLGDYYQLTVTATGPGNSGGPVFDDQGRVIGIFSNGSVDIMSGTKITFAVPISYGAELMGRQQPTF